VLRQVWQCCIGLISLCLVHLVCITQALRKSLIDQKRIINTIPDAPVFHPTVEEFSNVLEYIASIKKAGEAAGIVKIVPPPGKLYAHGQRMSDCRHACNVTVTGSLYFVNLLIT